MIDGPDSASRLRKLGLSHIEFIGRPLTPEGYSFLTNLPNLTHLGFFALTRTPPSIIIHILSSLLVPRLKVLTSTTLHYGVEGKQECLDEYESIGINDIRFVRVSYAVRTHILDRLDDLMARDFGMWKFAEDIIENRMKKIKANNAEEVQE
ncbi:hypothetical protein BDN72DRAFT_833519 [Pluteus cervinus]|uniref:Uncharacterized protein n=1 Tax=Pluteus cervinus TaxID=181527 RepID=A0ACD3BB46_9AGAR|nr:hypothetical protein BDN72DRAFT_833519 [Pluteus cervinus]